MRNDPYRPIEDPVEVEAPHGGRPGTKITHPAFGQIMASRVTGRGILYGSDFTHQHYVTIQIKRSELWRHLSHDYLHERDQLIEVALSEAQWARFVSSLNAGEGAQCTIERIDRVKVPGLPDPTDRRQQFTDEMAEHNARPMAAAAELADVIRGGKIPPVLRAQLLNLVSKLAQDLGPNTAFVAKSFDEHVEKTLERAKIEVNAYINAQVTKAGLAALGAAPEVPLTLDTGDSRAQPYCGGDHD